MDRRRVYLDHNATSPVRPEVRDAVVAAMADPANASSVHGEGRAARRLVEDARQALAEVLDADARDVTFVSSGTEANVTALTPHWTIDGQPVDFTRLFVSASEHASVLCGGRFAKDAVERIPIGADGIVDPNALRRLLSSQPGPVLVSVMAANNETGVLQPIAEISAIVHEFGGYLHCDAVQSLGKSVFSLSASGADAVSVSAHKIGGLTGAGALVTRRGIGFRPLLTGGGQESYRRAGTENVPAIAGFGAAILAMGERADEMSRLTRLRDWMERELVLVCKEAVIVGCESDRLVNTTCVGVPGLRAETAMIAFDLDGISVSSGAACSSGKVSASHVLMAMGMDDTVVNGAIRISLGWSSTEDDISRFLHSFKRIAGTQRPQGQNQAA